MNSHCLPERTRSIARLPHSGSLEDLRRGSGGKVERQIELDHVVASLENPAAAAARRRGDTTPPNGAQGMLGGDVRRSAATAFTNPLRPLLGTVSGNGRGGGRRGPEGATEPALRRMNRRLRRERLS